MDGHILPQDGYPLDLMSFSKMNIASTYHQQLSIYWLIKATHKILVHYLSFVEETCSTSTQFHGKYNDQEETVLNQK